ncbi:MAG: arsenate reductase ArsC [Pseudomonadota bacterium]
MRLLFVCTHNRCRSIIAEAVTRHLAGDCFDVASAGSAPAGVVHPLSLHHLAQRDIPTGGLASKSFDDVSQSPFDIVVTLCDSAAGEPCPLWLEPAEKVHWGLADPSRIVGDGQTVRAAFHETIDILVTRIQTLRREADALASAALLAERMRSLASDKTGSVAAEYDAQSSK